jgi:hypothetical protein
VGRVQGVGGRGREWNAAGGARDHREAHEGSEFLTTEAPSTRSKKVLLKKPSGLCDLCVSVVNQNPDYRTAKHTKDTKHSNNDGV